ncbi:sulfatase-like hydrolase/transferase [Chloroflexi bacterium TSY]|nr:sulfatase-like hydrolase/transferase [Chloroflexi bacterium TSY]
MNDRPNIILIITDQQRYETIGALGYSHVDTPHLDRLVNEGVAFSQCHVNSPSCGPSRASLFTGHFPHNSGVQRNNDPWPRIWVQDLREAGYYCVNIGKMHADPYSNMHGFHERFVVENKQRRLAEPLWSGNPHVFDDEWDKALAVQGFERPEKEAYMAWPDARERQGCFEWKLPENLHPDVFTGDLALRWIDKAPNEMEEPLFLQVGFPGPHPPFDPIERYVKPYMERDLEILPVTEAEMAGQPETLKSLRARIADRKADSIDFDPLASDEQRQRQRAYYLANMTMIDEQVGRILEALEQRDMLENSVVIFTSDHGDCLGDHGLVEKWNMYDSSVRVPLVVWSPKRYQGSRVVDALTQWFDIGPTILDLAGAEPTTPMEAQSLLPFLKNEGEIETERHRYVFSEHAPDLMLQNVGYLYMVRDERYKLVDYRGMDEGQLFDLTSDPNETVNLWSDSSHQGTRQRLQRTLDDWLASSISLYGGWWLKG